MYYTLYDLIILIFMFDSYMFYKTTVRSIMRYKSKNITNINHIPNYEKIILFFPISKIDDLDDVQMYNYIYLFKFFFGRRSFLTKYKSFFSLGKWTFSLRACVISSNMRFMHSLVWLFCNDFLSFIDKPYRNTSLLNKFCIYKLVLNDTNLFSDRKTNLGLFFLKNNLIIHFYFKKSSKLNYFLLPKNNKYYF